MTGCTCAVEAPLRLEPAAALERVTVAVEFVEIGADHVCTDGGSEHDHAPLVRSRVVFAERNVHDSRWHLAVAGVHDHNWQAEFGERRVATVICAGCLVRQEYLTHALDNGGAGRYFAGDMRCLCTICR